MHQEFIEQERVYDFLVGLNVEFYLGSKFSKKSHFHL